MKSNRILCLLLSALLFLGAGAIPALCTLADGEEAVVQTAPETAVPEAPAWQEPAAAPVAETPPTYVEPAPEQPAVLPVLPEPPTETGTAPMQDVPPADPEPIAVTPPAEVITAEPVQTPEVPLSPEVPAYTPPEIPAYTPPQVPVQPPVIPPVSTGGTASQGSTSPKPPVSKPNKDDAYDYDTGIKVEHGKLLDVPYINQQRDYPNGCESVSAVMALKYAGVDISVEKFIKNHLPTEDSPHFEGETLVACDPRKAYPGNPRDNSGWGCYPEVIKAAVDDMKLKKHKAIVLKDVALSTLCTEYIDKDIPVVLWATIDMLKPYSFRTWRIEGTNEEHTYVMPFHCLVLVGYDEDSFYFNDPWRAKQVSYPKNDVERAYSGLGREALVIVKK